MCSSYPVKYMHFLSRRLNAYVTNACLSRRKVNRFWALT